MSAEDYLAALDVIAQQGKRIEELRKSLRYAVVVMDDRFKNDPKATKAWELAWNGD